MCPNKLEDVFPIEMFVPFLGDLRSFSGGAHHDVHSDQLIANNRVMGAPTLNLP